MIANENIGIRNSQEKIGYAISFILSHYKEDISLRQIANTVNLSPYHFCRAFKKQSGIAFNKYLSGIRIEKSKEFLKGTSLTITDICFEVGFNNMTHFERIFKSLVGMTPSGYRQFLDGNME